MLKWKADSLAPLTEPASASSFVCAKRVSINSESSGGSSWKTEKYTNTGCCKSTPGDEWLEFEK